MKFKIELHEIGRTKYSETFISDYKNRHEAEFFAFRKVTKYLLSREVDMVRDSLTENTYKIYAGFHFVGTVKISPVEKENDN